MFTPPAATPLDESVHPHDYRSSCQASEHVTCSGPASFCRLIQFWRQIKDTERKWSKAAADTINPGVCQT